jgi:hypothetical protein
MAAKNTTLVRGTKIVAGKTSADIYYSNPIPITNITSIKADSNATQTSGNISISSFPVYGIDFFNEWLGETGIYNLATSGFTRISSIFGLDLLRPNIPISGSKIIKY